MAFNISRGLQAQEIAKQAKEKPFVTTSEEQKYRLGLPTTYKPPTFESEDITVFGTPKQPGQGLSIPEPEPQRPSDVIEGRGGAMGTPRFSTRTAEEDISQIRTPSGRGFAAGVEQAMRPQFLQDEPTREFLQRTEKESPTLFTLSTSKQKAPEYLEPITKERDITAADIGRGAGEVGKQLFTYGLASKAVAGKEIAPLFKGMSPKAQEVVSTGLTDLIIDNIAQAPGNVIEAIEQDKSLDQVGKDLLIQNAFDIAFNTGIGVAGQYIKSLKTKPQVLEQIAKESPEQLQQVIKSDPNIVKDLQEVAEAQRVQPLKAEVPKQDFEMEIPLPKTVDELAREGTGFKLREPSKPKNMEEVIVRSPNYKDVGVAERWNTDVYRQFEKVFGDDIDVVRREVLDPFDAAKKARVEDEIKLTDDLKKTVVDGLGIKKGSKESALVQRFGEGRITREELIKTVGLDRANKIIEADNWFRQQYDTLIDEINAPRLAQNKEPIPKREDYYRHYNEMGDTFSGIKNIFESNRKIDPNLEGLSEFTKPGEKWASFKQKRTGEGKFTEDAVGGFLDYVKAGTYAKHIDPEIPRFRKLQRDLAQSTTGTKNMNNFIGFLDEYANDLAGKTNKFDRATQDMIGRKAFAVANALNSRVKANAVLGNISSSLSQIANVPQGVAFVKNPQQLAGGLNGFFRSIAGGGDKALYDQSGFLKERLTDSFSKFDTKLLDQPKKLAGWMLGALDEVGTKYIWSSVYRKGLADGVPNPIKYADDITRKMVSGRGIGEVPIIQKSKLFQLVAPFTLEVNNLWKVQKDFLKNKDMAGLGMLFAGNFLLNNVMEEVRGSGVVFDPIDAIIQGAESGEGLGDKVLKAGGSLAGEVLTNVPLGQFAATAYPEYGGKIGELELPTRKELFGESDPTRFGVGLPVLKAIQDPLKNLALPYGGAQVSKAIKGAKATGLIPSDGLVGSYTKSGKLKTPVLPTPMSKAKGLAFGEGAIPEVRKYYDKKVPPLGTKQTENFEKLVTEENLDPQQLFEAFTEAREFTKKDERLEVLRNKGYNKREIKKISNILWGYK